MKKTLFKALLIGLLASLFSCNQEEVSPISSDFVGLWEEATGKKGVYDVKIARPDDYVFSLIDNGQIVASVPGGFIRNDTLLFDNGVQEYQLFIRLDTLIYSTKISDDIEKLVRIE